MSNSAEKTAWGRFVFDIDSDSKPHVRSKKQVDRQTYLDDDIDLFNDSRYWIAPYSAKKSGF